MIANKKEFYGGVVLMAAFLVVLVIIFMPVFHGKNGLDYLDELYNSISKGSAYYIPAMQKEAATLDGNKVTLTLALAKEDQVRQVADMLMKAGAMVNIGGKDLKASGDLGQILAACLADAGAMYHNNGKALSDKYRIDERQATYNWYQCLKAMEKSLNDQKLFAAAKVVGNIQKKAIETVYNYYKVQPQKIKDRVGVVLFSLVFYVFYTLWYGFAIMFMFEGWGLKLEH
jgi:H2-forming N5,N10-methylenetetrahydromethanopterin dehydrogenase-like enzyme